jgi:hypothetical protein
MRKRSEVVGPSAGAPLPGQQGMFQPKVAPTCPKCGLSQSRALIASNDGKCMRCDTLVPIEEPAAQAAAQPAAPPPPPAAPAKEPDPWQLNPESVKVKPQQPMGPDPTSIGDLSANLKKNGTDISLPELAKKSPEERRELHEKATNPRFDMQSFQTGETVFYTWGKETITPVVGSYSSTEIGPISGSTTVRPGETHTQALERLRHEITAQAVSERESKVRSFLGKLTQTVKEARS